MIYKKYFKAKFLYKKLEFHFYAILSAHNSNPKFGELNGTYSNDINSLDLYQKIENLCSNSSLECLLSKTFSPHLRIPYRSNVNVKTMTEVHVSTHFQSD